MASSGQFRLTTHRSFVHNVFEPSHGDNVVARYQHPFAVPLDAGRLRLGDVQFAGGFRVAQVVEVCILQLEEPNVPAQERTQGDVLTAQVNDDLAADQLLE